MLPPGEATAPAHVGRVADPQQLRGSRRRLDDQLPGQLRVEAGVGAGVGERLDRERQVGGRAAHHRGRRVELLVGELDDVAEQLEHRPHLGRLRSPATQSTPRRTSTATFGITRITSAPGKAASTRASGVAPSSETTASAPRQLGGDLLEPRRLHREHDDVGPLGQLGVGVERLAARPRRPASAARPEPESVNSIPSTSPAQPARHGRGHAARPAEADNHGAAA